MTKLPEKPKKDDFVNQKIKKHKVAKSRNDEIAIFFTNMTILFFVVFSLVILILALVY